MKALKVMVVEGEPWMGEQFERSLTKHGAQVAVTSNAYSAMDMIDEFRPDAVIMGLMLSGVGGLSLLHELQSYSDTAKIPVIVCVGNATDIAPGELEPYGVTKVIDMSTMRPDDLPAAVRSAVA